MFIVVLSMITYTGFCTQYTNMSIITIFPWLLENKFGMTESDAGLIMGSQAIPTFLSLVVIFMPLSSHGVPMPLLACLGMIFHSVMITLPFVDNETGVIFLSYCLNLGGS
mmetsp:Transcript_1173/g.1141  ORF Transcript_1173/g.1141 Transcript_1173/m.1141 type:complete len:110 (-) Transcript_1173:150-479(-)